MLKERNDTMSPLSINQDQIYDVAICGGGLAGLTLARQLKRALPEASVIIIDRQTLPLPVAAFKVGESMTEAGGYYLGKVLGLTDYLEKNHVVKLGFRFFFNDGSETFAERPEFGLSRFPKVDSYQVDRGTLETDLWTMNLEMGVDIVEGMSVRDILLSDDDNTPHTVLFQRQGEADSQAVQARWVVDAMGRRRFLQKKLGLQRERTRQQFNAAWFRYLGEVDLSDLVPSTDVEWHDRVPSGRYDSTNHLMGPGYWVWLIPLASGYTSIGIVAHEGLHPFETFNTYSRAVEWLSENEPGLHRMIAEREPEDFRVMRHYSYTSRQVFSAQRWACSGDAGVFADPFYAAGTEIIGFCNTITIEMIRHDMAGTLTPEQVTGYNQFVLSYNDALTDNIQVAYPFFGNPVVMTAKVLWDTTAAWAFVGVQMFNSTYLDAEKSARLRAVTAPFFFLTRRMQQVFVDWAERSPGRLTYEFFDFLTLDYLYKLRVRNLRADRSIDQLIADQEENMARIEELAQVLFLLALEDVMPEHLDQFQEPVWLNAWRLGLNPDRWEADTVFRPKSEPRDIREMRRQIRAMFKRKESGNEPAQEPAKVSANGMSFVNETLELATAER